VSLFSNLLFWNEFQTYLYTAEFWLHFVLRQVLNLFCPFFLHLRASDSKGSERGKGGVAPCIPNFGIWWKLVVTFTLRPLSCTEKTPSCFPKKRLDKPASPVWAAGVTNRSLAPTESRTMILRRPTHVLNISLCHLSYDRTLYVCLITAVLWLRRLDADLTPMRIGFDPGPLCVGFVVDKVTMEQVSKLVFPCYYHCISAPCLFISLLCTSFNCGSWQHCEQHPFCTTRTADTISILFLLTTQFLTRHQITFACNEFHIIGKLFLLFTFPPGSLADITGANLRNTTICHQDMCVPCKMASVMWWMNRMEHWSSSEETQRFA